jgi:hypothetical protein
MPQSPSRGLPKGIQLLIVAMIALTAIGLFALNSLTTRFTSKSNEAQAQPSASPNSFRPTDDQWKSLKIVPVELKLFQDAHTTDGKIANDDDTTTPVFSPYSGRVTKLFEAERSPSSPSLFLQHVQTIRSSATSSLADCLTKTHRGIDPKT